MREVEREIGREREVERDTSLVMVIVPYGVIATTKLTRNSTLITLEGRLGTADHVTFLQLLSIRMVVLLPFHIAS